MEIMEYLKIQVRNEQIADPTVNDLFEQMKVACLERSYTDLDELGVKWERACQQFYAKDRQIGLLLAKVRKEGPQQVDGYELSYGPDIRLTTRTVYYTEEQTKDDSSLIIVGGNKPIQSIKLNANRQAILDALPQAAGLRFVEWKQAVDRTREKDGLPAMAKQTFIDNINWLIERNMARKVGTETGTEQNTYWRNQSQEEEGE